MNAGELAVLVVQLLVGFVLTAVLGLVTSSVDRIVTARVQMRKGPPVLQPFYDVIKLMVKETCIPAAASRMLFLSAPLAGIAGVALASTILLRAVFLPGGSFSGDVIVLLYLLTLPAIAVVLGSFASANPLASIGGSREMKLIMSYELPFVLAVVVAMVQTGGIRLNAMLAQPIALSLSGALALIVAIVCMQAKLTLIPFDQPEAETELTGGAYVEYSGPPLAIFKLTRAMMLFTMPMFLVVVFCGGIVVDAGVVPVILGVLKYLGLVVVVVLIRNTAPRVRIDQAMKFFWGPVAGVALLAVILAILGL